jgi:hypothetical protein
MEGDEDIAWVSVCFVWRSGELEEEDFSLSVGSVAGLTR